MSHRAIITGITLAALTLARSGSSAPLMDSRVGGLSLVGPSSAHPASFYFNPAALGLQSAYFFQAFLSSTLRLGHGSIQRAPIDPSTGEAGSSGSLLRTFDEQSLLTLSPQAFVALISNLGSESVVLSLSAYNPVSQFTSFLRGAESEHFDPTAQGPQRYHGTDMSFLHIYATLAASIKVVDWLHVGVSTSFIHSRVNVGFVRDIALDGGEKLQPGELVALDDCGAAARCGYESDDAAEAVRVEGSSWGMGFSAGILVLPHRALEIGLAYNSRTLPIGVEDATARGDAFIRRARAVMASAPPGTRQDIKGRGAIEYDIPDAVNLGATWRTTSRLTLNLQLRWLNFSNHDQLHLRLTGSELRKEPHTTSRIDIHRGFQDVVAVQIGAAFQVTDALQVQVASMIETAAVPEESVTAAAIDNVKVDSFVSVRLRLGQRFVLGVGYGLVAMPGTEVGDSIFSPGAKVRCVDSFFDVDLPACKETGLGRGLPTAAGSYFLMVHRFGLSLTYRYEDE